MTATPLPTPASEDFPASWSEGAIATFEAITTARPDLSASEEAALWQACTLESTADHLDEIASGAGYMTVGSTGQAVVHPAVVEARLARTAAAAIFNRLTSATAGAMTNSQRGMAAARARWGHAR